MTAATSTCPNTCIHLDNNNLPNFCDEHLFRQIFLEYTLWIDRNDGYLHDLYCNIGYCYVAKISDCYFTLAKKTTTSDFYQVDFIGFNGTVTTYVDTNDTNNESWVYHWFKKYIQENPFSFMCTLSYLVTWFTAWCMTSCFW